MGRKQNFYDTPEVARANLESYFKEFQKTKRESFPSHTLLFADSHGALSPYSLASTHAYDVDPTGNTVTRDYKIIMHHPEKEDHCKDVLNIFNKKEEIRLRRRNIQDSDSAPLWRGKEYFLNCRVKSMDTLDYENENSAFYEHRFSLRDDIDLLLSQVERFELNEMLATGDNSVSEHELLLFYNQKTGKVETITSLAELHTIGFDASSKESRKESRYQAYLYNPKMDLQSKRNKVVGEVAVNNFPKKVLVTYRSTSSEKDNSKLQTKFSDSGNIRFFVQKGKVNFDLPKYRHAKGVYERTGDLADRFFSKIVLSTMAEKKK